MEDISPSHVISVAIQRPLYKLLDYTHNESSQLLPGMRVKVPLGNTVITAIVIKTNVSSEFSELKSILDVIDNRPLLDKDLLSLLKWAANYYFYPEGEVIFHALPGNLRKAKPLPKTKLWSLSSTGLAAASSDALKRAPKQRLMAQFLVNKECDALQLQNEFGSTWKNIVKQLLKKELIVERLVETESSLAKPAFKELSQEESAVQLTEEQQNCVNDIIANFSNKQHKPILLYGVTGSGKTEVYFHSISQILEQQQQVLVLVPEIGLTPQLLSRFKQYFPQYNIVTLHSGLTPGERLQNWLGAQSGAVDIVIGTRSAVFAPMKNLGAIIVDEEHDGSFKQQEGFLYHGRDVAIKRAHDLAIPILLGSATPSLETLYNAEQGRYEFLRLRNRPGTRKRPKMGIQDIRALPLEAGISHLLINEIRQHIENQQQVMLFLNRRGFAPVLMCPSCGWHAVCRQCDIGMTYHATSHKVICHHCGVEEQVGAVCPDCGSDRLTTQGQGTERVEKVLNTYFPDVSVIRVDRDSTSKKGTLEKKLKQVKTGMPVILIGTQMLTKGHDFPNLTLVGILDVDQALFSMDFRAQEKLAQQIIQVAGRAGRGEKKGNVVLQSSQPEHPLLIELLSLGYYQSAKHILNDRQVWNYPPYGAQALVRASSTNVEAGFNFLAKLNSELSNCLDDNIFMLGPIASPLAKRSGRYRFQLLFSASKRSEIHMALSVALQLLVTYRKAGGIRWSIDIDPTEFL